MIGIVKQDVPEPEPHEAASCLKRGWIESDDSGIALEFEGAHASVGHDESDGRQRADAEACPPRIDRESRVG